MAYVVRIFELPGASKLITSHYVQRVHTRMHDARCNDRLREYHRKSRHIWLFNFRVIYEIRRHIYLYVSITKGANFLSSMKLVIYVVMCKDKKIECTFTQELRKARDCALLMQEGANVEREREEQEECPSR